MAAVIHAELLLVVGIVMYVWAPRNGDLLALGAGRGADSGETVEVTTLDDAESRKILAELEREQEKAEEEAKKKEEESKDAPGQVVEIPKPREEKRPESARFAAEHDSTVEKETKKYGKFDDKARQGDRAGDAEQSRAPTPPSPEKQASQPTPPGMMAMRTPPGPEGPQGPPGLPGERAQAVPGRPGEDVEAPPDKDGDMAPLGTGQPVSPRPPAGGGGGQPSVAPGAKPTPLLPNEQQLARAIGSGTQDFLKDVDEGDETALNTKKWKFASFFNRVKQQVRDHWHPAEEYHRRDPTGRIYGQQNRYTLLRVQLKPDGTLANVAMQTPSGVEFLDDEAIEAFKQAQPFPNPPKQLVGESGMITFSFGFFFELSGAPRMKVFQYQQM